MKKTHDKNWSFIYTLLIIFLIIITIIQFSKIDSTNSRIDSLNKNFERLVLKDSTLLKEVRYYQFKEDSYLRQQERDTNLILWFIAIVFGLFGIISYSSFNKRISLMENEVDDKLENHVKRLSHLQNNLLELEGDLNNDSSSIAKMEADESLELKLYDAYLFYRLLASRKMSKYCEFKKGNDEKTATHVIGYIKSDLTSTLVTIEGLAIKPKMTKETFCHLTKIIRSLDDVILTN